MASTNVEASSLMYSPSLKGLSGSPKQSRNLSFKPKPEVTSINCKIPPSQSQICSAPALQSTSSRFSLGNRIRIHDRGISGKLSPNYPKIGPQRTTKNLQKLKLLPNPDFQADGQDEESGRDVYSQYTRIKDPNARRDAARLGKADRDRLPRVTAYCTAGNYQIDKMMRFLKGRSKTRGTNPRLVDECIYTPFSYEDTSHHYSTQAESSFKAEITQDKKLQNTDVGMDQMDQARREDLINFQTERERTTPIDASNHAAYEDKPVVEDRLYTETNPDFDTQVHTPEIFLFNYGVVVIWGMSVHDEERFLKEIAKFETEKLNSDHVETECFNFYYTQEYQAQIYNDFITLRDKGAYMIKLAISHALAQSVKTSLFEELVDNTIEACKDIPGQIATTGKIALTRKQINMQIGELFILRINIHLNGSVLDTPEIFWLEPQLEPVYQAVRSYLEIDQRVSLLTGRLAVIADLLAVLKDQLSHRHGEMLEWIVIVLIAAEIIVAAINILVDLSAGGIE